MTGASYTPGTGQGPCHLPQWLSNREAEDLASNPNSVATLLCDLGQVTFPL